MNQNSDVARALGMNLWRTDSFVPRYQSGEIGPWKINPGGQLVNDWGYFTGPCLLEMLPSLSRRVVFGEGADGDEWEVWMSLTPHEIESQELGYRHAFGNMVVMGLGMGWIAANAALNPNVAAVTVVERDHDVIALFQESGAFDSLPTAGREKINIVRADAMEWIPGPAQSIDFLYADIWLHLAEPETLRQVRRMQDNVRAKKIYYWGQEIAIHSAASRIARPSASTGTEYIQQVVTDVIQLPLMVPVDCDYEKMIGLVIKNRIERQLPVEIELG